MKGIGSKKVVETRSVKTTTGKSSMRLNEDSLRELLNLIGRRTASWREVYVNDELTLWYRLVTAVNEVVNVHHGDDPPYQRRNRSTELSARSYPLVIAAGTVLHVARNDSDTLGYVANYVFDGRTVQLGFRGGSGRVPCTVTIRGYS